MNLKQLTLDWKNNDDNLVYAGGYDSLLESAGLQMLSWTYVGDYQGDIYTVVFDPEEARYGFTVIGYGSCSGCDAYEACSDSVEELTELRDSLLSGIVWRDSKGELVGFLLDRDHAGQWYCYDQDGWETAATEIGNALGMSEEAISAMKEKGIRYY